MLVFLPGQEDIEALAQLLSENLSTLRAERSRYVHEKNGTFRFGSVVEVLSCVVSVLRVCNSPGIPVCEQVFTKSGS